MPTSEGLAEPEYVDEDRFGEPRMRRRRRPLRRDLAPHRGTLILVLGILSIVVCGPIIGPITWVMGNNLREMRAGRMDPEGESLTNAGRICGIIATALALAVCGFYVIMFAIVAAGGAVGFR